MTDPGTTPTPPPAGESQRPSWLVPAIVVAVVVVAVVVVLLIVLRSGDDEDSSPSGTTAPTTSAPATTASSAPATSAPTSTFTTVVPDALRPAVWPWPDTSRRFGEPGPAAYSFATELVGFTDPVVGEFRQGDSRSGEIEVRPTPDGPATTVFLRQLSDDGSWWVIGAATANIEVDQPTALSAIDDPLQVSGRAATFEGNVVVQVRADGSFTPLGQGNVTGRGDGVLGPFSGEISWDNPGGGWGAVVFLSTSAKDGRVWEAGVVRVGFIGGD